MKKGLLGLIIAMVLLSVVGCSSSSTSGEGKKQDAKEGKKSVTITFGVTPWSSTVPPTKIASLILKDMGYTIKEMNADAGSVYTGLSRGDIDVFMDSWIPAHTPYLEKYKDSIEDTAISYKDAATGWVVPKYMTDINSIADLKGKESEVKNEMYSIEVGTSASKTIDEMIKAYGLDIKQVNSSEAAMLAEAMRKMAKKEPVIFFGWRPHTMFNKFDLKVLKDDKNFLSVSDIHVITNKKLKETAPDAYKFLSNWSIPIDDVEEMIAKIENKEDAEKVAQEWIKNNPDKVKEMTGK
ncbi:glycine betaine ABC transporter substrate-binding protein [Neobacillus sp. GCM10023253]